jgi:hypothetical protein
MVRELVSRTVGPVSTQYAKHGLSGCSAVIPLDVIYPLLYEFFILVLCRSMAIQMNVAHGDCVRGELLERFAV